MHTDTPSHGPALDLLIFGLAAFAGLMLTPVRGLLLRTLPHAAWHPGCTH